MKRKRFIKPLCLVLAAVLVLLGVPLSASAEAGASLPEEPALKAVTLDGDQLHDIANQSTGRLPDELLQNLSLRESDIPESMKDTDIRETEAVARVKAREDDMSSLIYVNRDGTYTEYFFSENVKYEKDGNVSDKSNKLTSSLLYGGYVNRENDINTVLPYIIAKDNGIKVSYKDSCIEFVPAVTEGSSAAYKTKDDTVIYGNAFGQGVSLEYTAQFSGIKENIIISSDNGIYDFGFTVKTNGLYLKTADNHAVLYDNKDEVIAEIGGVVIYDAEGKPGKGSFEIKEIEPGKEYVYTVSVSKDFIKSVDTVFPVTVDPTLTYNSGAYIYDSQITHTVSDTYVMDYSSSTIIIGYTGTSTYSKELVNLKSAVSRVRTLEDIDLLVEATLTIKPTPNLSNTVTFNCYRMNQSWNYASTSGSSAIWNGYVSGSEISCTVMPIMFVYDLRFLLTDYFRYWYENDNYGIVIAPQMLISNYTLAAKENPSTSLKPYVTIKYGPLPTQETVTDKGLYKICSATDPYLYGFPPLYCNRTDNSTYALSFTSTATTSSTLDSSPFFAFRYVSGGYYTISPTNANFRGSSSLYDEGLNKEYFLYRNGTSITLSTVSGTDNNAYWYPVAVGDYYFLVNKGNTGYCLCVSGNFNGVSYSPNDYRWDLVFVGLDVPLIKQLPHYCGAATSLQIIEYLGEENKITNYNNYTGNTLDEKYQKALANAMHYNDDDGIIRVFIKTLFNEAEAYEEAANDPNVNHDFNYYHKYDIDYEYLSYGASSFSDSNDLYLYIKNSIDNGFPVVLHVRTYPIDHYLHHNYPHYICLVGYDTANNTYIIRDCNDEDPDRNNASDFFGEFIVDQTQVYSSIKNYPNRGIVCYTYSQNLRRR